MKSAIVVIGFGLFVVAKFDALAQSHAGPAAAPAAESSARTVAEILSARDRSLIADLTKYIAEKPAADDLDQAYMAIFETAIQRDWFRDVEVTAKQYLGRFADGSVRPLAQIVLTMARAQADQFPEALSIYRDLMSSLQGEDQEEFASNFAENLALAAATAGDYGVARQVHEILLSQFGESPNLREKVRAELSRLDMIGKPAPDIRATDLTGKRVQLSDFKGKYVLVDFWATWCAPCIAELPNQIAAYNQFRQKGLEVIGVSLDDTPQPVADFVQARKVPWTQFHNPTCGSDLVAAYRVGNIPATFLIGPDGTLLRLELRGQALEKALKELIN